MWRIEFTSERFLPYLPEECQSNPGPYGFELAQWLSQRLAESGVVTGYPLGEDWGWFIEYIDGEIEIMVGCSSEATEGDGYKGKPLAWRVFVKQTISLKQRFKGASAPEKVREIANAISSLLQAEGLNPRVTEA